MAHPGARSSAGAGAVYVGLPMETATAPAAPPPAAGALVARAATLFLVACATARLTWAATLFLVGCATAALAISAMLLPLADDSRLARIQGKRACAPAPETDLRAAFDYLLMAGTAHLVAATMGRLLVPARPLRYFRRVFASFTASRALDVLRVFADCLHGSTAHGWLAALRYWICIALLFALFNFYIAVSNR